MKKLNFIIPLVIYPFDVLVSIGETNKEIKKCLLKYTNITDEDIELSQFKNHTITGRSAMFSSNQSLIRLKYYPTEAKDFGVLQHEIFHCVTVIMDAIGMKFKVFKSDEAYAYLIGYLTTEIYKKINEKTK